MQKIETKYLNQDCIFKKKYWCWSKCVVSWMVKVLRKACGKQTCDSSGGWSKSDHSEDVLVRHESCLAWAQLSLRQRTYLGEGSLDVTSSGRGEIRKQILKSWNSYHAFPYHSSNVNADFKLKFSRLKLTQCISRHIAFLDLCGDADKSWLSMIITASIETISDVSQYYD